MATINDLIDAVRAERMLTENELERLERRRVKLMKEMQDLDEVLPMCLVDCPGEAHKQEARLRVHCPTCHPRWGKVPNRRCVTKEERIDEKNRPVARGKDRP